MEKKFLTLIKNGISENWERPALTDLGSKTYHYKDMAQEIAKLHILFEALEIKQGDKIALCDKNSSHWAIAFFASMSYGAVVTSILNDFDGLSIENIINHSESKVLFAGKQTMEKVDLANIANTPTVIMTEDFSLLRSATPKAEEIQMKLGDLLAEKHPAGFTPQDMYFYNEHPEELAMLNYTSGTTSTPKGVMIPYRSLWSNTKFAMEEIPFVEAGDGMICMLPMAHMYGLAFEVLLSMAKGSHLHFLTRVPSPQVILGAFSEVNPRLVITVPLIIEKIIQNKVFPELKKFPVNILTAIPFFRKRIYKKIADKLIPLFGNKMVEAVIGGAGLNQEVGAFLSAIKFPYTVGYGMTECGPLISYAYWEEYKATSCGKPVDRMQVKIDSEHPETEAGEILVKGDNVMIGYYKNEEATRDTFTNDGWLRTGDLGIMDKENHIFIKGRLKTMILGPSGQNIYPEEIEDFYNNSPYIAESLIIEENHKLIALIYPDKDYMEAHEIAESEFPKLFTDEMKAINKRLPGYSKVVNFRLQEKEFEKTPKRSIKRFLYQK